MRTNTLSTLGDGHVIDHLADGKLRDKSTEESWELIEDLALTSDCRLIELASQVERLMEAHVAPKPSVQVNKTASSCEICGGPHDTQYCMKISSKLLLIMYPRVPTKQENQGGKHRKMESEVPNRCDYITSYEDSDQEDGELLDLPTFSATNEFASVCEQGEYNIDVNTTQELEKVQVEDVEMDED
ncbi:hypothetical protein Tco_0779153 [Tanacetum coccineum]